VLPYKIREKPFTPEIVSPSIAVKRTYSSNSFPFFLLSSLFLSCTFLGLASPATAQRLSATERKIMNQVARNMPQAEALVEEAVRINSGTMNFGGVRRVGRVFARELEQLGFEARWVDLPDSLNRAGHLFAERQGSKGKRLLLIGHLDTVFDGDSIRQGFERAGNKLKGPGVNDMKGGNVVMVYALRALHQLGLLDSTQIIVALTGDEEEGGRPLAVSRRDLREAGQRSDIALAFETAIGLDNATIARRGVSSWRLEVTGQQAHSAGLFGSYAGSGAIFEASRILHQFHEEFRGQQYLTVNPGLILGGTEVSFDSAQSTGTAYGKTNVVAGMVTVTGDMRYISNEQEAQTQARMREIVAQHLPATSARIIFKEGYPAMQPKEANLEVLQVLDRVSRDMGAGPVKAYDPGGRGAGDIAFVADDLPALDGLGVMGGGAHTPQETMDLRSFKLLTQRAALLIYRLTR
jgi:glutamate carboxypeptidase